MFVGMSFLILFFFNAFLLSKYLIKKLFFKEIGNINNKLLLFD